MEGARAGLSLSQISDLVCSPSFVHSSGLDEFFCPYSFGILSKDWGHRTECSYLKLRLHDPHVHAFLFLPGSLISITTTGNIPKTGNCVLTLINCHGNQTLLKTSVLIVLLLDKTELADPVYLIFFILFFLLNRNVFFFLSCSALIYSFLFPHCPMTFVVARMRFLSW